MFSSLCHWSHYKSGEAIEPPRDLHQGDYVFITSVYTGKSLHLQHLEHLTHPSQSHTSKVFASIIIIYPLPIYLFDS